jgi:hypothetical protein
MRAGSPTHTTRPGTARLAALSFNSIPAPASSSCLSTAGPSVLGQGHSYLRVRAQVSGSHLPVHRLRVAASQVAVPASRVGHTASRSSIISPSDLDIGLSSEVRGGNTATGPAEKDYQGTLGFPMSP